jgi:hypothetical protein
LTISQIIKVDMSLAAEARLGAFYINSQEAILLWQLLEEMGRPQPPTPIQIDNSTALGIITSTIQPKHTKAMDMRFHWHFCRANQKQFCTYWWAGSTNLGNFVTKHHPVIHHQSIRTIYLTASHHPASLAGPTQSSHCKGVVHMPTLCKVNSGISSGTRDNRL